jgi:uncharacterized protein
MKSKSLNWNKIILILFITFLTGCATYYMKTLRFHENVFSGKMKEADQIMLKDKKGIKGKNAILHFLNHGYVAFMLNDYTRSNQYFSTADKLIEDEQKNYLNETFALLTNPMVKPYKPEDFEVVMLNYFTALNYIYMGQYDEALVECKRINIKLDKLNDKYGQHKDRYQHDAFAHMLMGLIYDANGDYNNAFIAYRNSLEVYESDYSKYFNLQAPLQLKKDLLRTAYLTGFYSELEEYEKKFGMKFKNDSISQNDLVFIWLNGFGPVKSEWSVNFTAVRGQGGMVTFVNDENGLSFPFPTGDMNNQDKTAFSDLHLLRVAFPKYVERKPFYTSAELLDGNNIYNIELAENINDIAFKTLSDRMLREFANSLLRLAVKKSLEEFTRRQNKDVGAVLGIINALTEKADTRNWQTLPYSFSYARIPLIVGSNSYKLKVYSANGETRLYDFSINAEKGKTYFQSFHNIESFPLDLGSN